MALEQYLKKESIIEDLQAGSKEEALAGLVGAMLQSCPGLDREEVMEVMRKREALGSTGIGDGVAIPHGKTGHCGDILVAVARSAKGCDFAAVDGRPCHVFCALLAPEEAVAGHLSILARFARIFRSREFRARFMEAENAEAIWKLLDDAWSL
ncbi:PTS sugar transporter subunit IIA [Desulfovibrio sp. OttesenSCG-928-C14]|nr:PTS sugar transporter subunit IIA [Desulfovibrio sp. OttesenSCG-928-C14]